MPKSEAARNRFDHLRPAKALGGWTVFGDIESANLTEFDNQSESERNDEVENGFFQFAPQFSTAARRFFRRLGRMSGKVEGGERNDDKVEINRDYQVVSHANYRW